MKERLVMTTYAQVHAEEIHKQFGFDKFFNDVLKGEELGFMWFCMGYCLKRKQG